MFSGGVEKQRRTVMVLIKDHFGRELFENVYEIYFLS